MKIFNDFLAAVLPYTEWVMLFLIVGGGLYLVAYSKLLPYRYFKHAILITSGKYDNPDDPGEVSHLQALSSAVAATVGLGNISGVAIAIYLGGPGVVQFAGRADVLHYHGYGQKGQAFGCVLLYCRPLWCSARIYDKSVYPNINGRD